MMTDSDAEAETTTQEKAEHNYQDKEIDKNQKERARNTDARNTKVQTAGTSSGSFSGTATRTTPTRRKTEGLGRPAPTSGQDDRTPRVAHQKVQTQEQPTGPEGAAQRWAHLLRRMATNRRWSSQAFAAKMARRVRRSWNVDTSKPRGLGGRWGWREVGVF